MPPRIAFPGAKTLFPARWRPGSWPVGGGRRALGCGAGKDFDAKQLRHHRICLLMDADSDGNHICTLLLTFFYRHLPELIKGGYVYIAQPPLYRVDIGKEVQWARKD